METYENEEDKFRRELSELLNRYKADMCPAKEYELYTGREYPVIEVTFDAKYNEVGQTVRPRRIFDL